MKLKDTSCSSCGYEELRFLHSVWNGERVRKFCTSCVLLFNKDAFCPTCLAIHDSESSDPLICCFRCRSFSHPNCFSSNGCPAKPASLCSSCINPNRLIFALSEVKTIGQSGGYAGMDKNAAGLLLTAAKIADMSMTKEAVISQNSAESEMTQNVAAKKKATNAVNHCVVETGNNNDVGLLVDSWIQSEEDSSPDTLRESGRLSGEGVEAQSSKVPIDFDLNKEYPSMDDAI